MRSSDCLLLYKKFAGSIIFADRLDFDSDFLAERRDRLMDGSTQ